MALLSVIFCPDFRDSISDLDISVVDGFGELEILAESLLLEVSHSKLISKGQEVQNSVP
jgi:hypothetical protein